MNLEFSALTPEYLASLSIFLLENDGCCRLCDYTPSTLLMWRDLYETAAAVKDGTVYLRFVENGETYYAFPVGKNPEHALATLEDALGAAPDFCNVPEEYLTLMQERYPHAHIYEERDWQDYLYETKSLAELVGRRYSGQRNHLKRFVRAYGTPEFLPFDEVRVREALDFLDVYDSLHPHFSEDAATESTMTRRLLTEGHVEGQAGGVLKADGRVFGFVIGEVVGDTLYDHIEKADATAAGAYQTLVNCFARAFSSVPYMNREEDCGAEGLRRSKLSYHPIRLLKKYVISQE